VRTLCFGEAIVDLICHRHVSSLAEADAFVAHQGGVSANVAVTAARAGADVALAGGAGDDAWGGWLHDRLEAEHVLLDWFRLAGAQRTGLTFVTVDELGEPTYELHGDGISATISGLKRRLLAAVDETDALFFGSNVLAGKSEAASARSSSAARSSSTRTSGSAAGITTAAARARRAARASPARFSSSATSPRRG
jgi:sugar/nucleoside kinase (ribokinase family)